MNLQRTLSGGSLRVLALPMKTAEVEGLGEGGWRGAHHTYCIRS